MSFTPWIKAARLRTLPLAVSGVLLGSFLALPHMNPVLAVMALLTAVLLQVLSNYANDYGDFKKGTDRSAGRADRMLTTGDIRPETMKTALMLLSLISFTSGCITLSLAEHLNATQLSILLASGIASIWAAVRYTTGKHAYGYYGLGDLAVVLFFGLFAVNGTYFLHTQTLNTHVAFCALGMGLLAAAVLHVNNTRDLVGDTLSNKQTMAARLGFAGARRYQLLLVLGGCSALCVPILLDYGRLFLIPAILIYLLGFLHLWRYFRIAQDARMDYNKELKFLSLSIFAMILIIGVWRHLV
ncbi:MAG: 1,4-dihydroxy-2-naphthoate octaprenyltransferase [Bacteroidetes bacterium]|nr:1,4-dihydroxy-2-naphthoate octaprenyltransferase [Bacteroidota bacterium]